MKKQVLAFLCVLTINSGAIAYCYADQREDRRYQEQQYQKQLDNKRYEDQLYQQRLYQKQLDNKRYEDQLYQQRLDNRRYEERHYQNR